MSSVGNKGGRVIYFYQALCHRHKSQEEEGARLRASRSQVRSRARCRGTFGDFRERILDRFPDLGRSCGPRKAVTRHQRQRHRENPSPLKRQDSCHRSFSPDITMMLSPLSQCLPHRRSRSKGSMLHKKGVCGTSGSPHLWESLESLLLRSPRSPYPKGRSSILFMLLSQSFLKDPPKE